MRLWNAWSGKRLANFWISRALVSIIIPFKNTEVFISECFDSIQDQTHTDWEVLAVNDGSSDRSYELVGEYASTDPRIKGYRNSGNGIIAALQSGYAHAQGEWITRMDSDDIMKPERLEHMLTALKAHGKGHVAVGQVSYFSDRGISDGYQRYEKWLNGLTEKGANYDEIYRECVIPSPCWMVYRSDFEACGGFNRERYPEDYDLVFRFYQHGYKVIPCQKVLHLWRDYDTRTSRTHEHYAENYFLDIKLDYFLQLDHVASRPLVIWGAGYKGKYAAKRLVSEKVAFTWLCDNPKKIGKKIYGVPLFHYGLLESLERPQSIVTVANAEAQTYIKGYMKEKGLSSPTDHYFFC